MTEPAHTEIDSKIDPSFLTPDEVLSLAAACQLVLRCVPTDASSLPESERAELATLKSAWAKLRFLAFGNEDTPVPPGKGDAK